jgi:hypothetical protein
MTTSNNSKSESNIPVAPEKPRWVQYEFVARQDCRNPEAYASTVLRNGGWADLFTNEEGSPYGVIPGCREGNLVVAVYVNSHIARQYEAELADALSRNRAVPVYHPELTGEEETEPYSVFFVGGTARHLLRIVKGLDGKRPIVGQLMSGNSQLVNKLVGYVYGKQPTSPTMPSLGSLTMAGTPSDGQATERPIPPADAKPKTRKGRKPAAAKKQQAVDDLQF